jgi:hypothetical protein
MAVIPVEEFSIGAGDVYLDDVLLGSTRENNVFRIMQNLAAPTINGVGGILARTDYHNTLPMAELEVTLLELSATTMPVMVPGAAVETVGEDTVIGPPATRRVQDADYHKWEIRVPGLSGRQLKYTILIGIVISNVEMANADDGSVPAGPRITIQSRIDPDDTTAQPWTMTKTPASYS